MLYEAINDQAQYQRLEIPPLEFIQTQIKFKKDKLSRKHTDGLKLRNILDIAKVAYIAND